MEKTKLVSLFSALFFISHVSVADPIGAAELYQLYGVVDTSQSDISTQFSRQPVRNKPTFVPTNTISSIAMTAAGVVEIGEPDMEIAFVKSSGVDKTLPEALHAILPKEWFAKKNHGVNRYMRVSWNKGSDWLKVLNDIATEYRLSISVDWNNRTVIVLNQDLSGLNTASLIVPKKDFSLDGVKEYPALQKDNSIKSVLKTDENPIFVTAPCNNPSGITYSDPLDEIEYGKAVKTAGDSVPLVSALKRILPKGWHADKTHDVDSDLSLSWDKDDDFTHVLNTVAHENNLSIKVFWKNKTIRVDAGCNASSSPVTAASSSANSAKDASLSGKAKTSFAISPVTAAPASDLQPLFIKGSLKDAAEKVANRWHNKIDWAVDETQGKFVLAYEIRIAGKNLEEDLHTLGEAASNDQLRLKFDIFENNVVKISQSGDE